VDALGSLAQTGRTSHRHCCVSGWDWASRNCWRDWWNGAWDIVLCDAPVDPFCKTSVLALSFDLVHSLGEVRLTFGKGLAMLLCPGWYPPFVQRLGPPFVGPASVPAAGAPVENLLLARSMR